MRGVLAMVRVSRGAADRPRAGKVGVESEVALAVEEKWRTTQVIGRVKGGVEAKVRQRSEQREIS